MNTTQYISFVHEVKRALGYDGVAWPGVNSVMETPVQEYTLEDKDISREISRMYWNAVYQDGKTNIPIEYLSGSLNSKQHAANNSKNINSVKAKIEQLKETGK